MNISKSYDKQKTYIIAGTEDGKIMCQPLLPKIEGSEN